MELEIEKKVKVQAKILKIHLKVSDRFSALLCDQDGAIIHDQDDGYVPDFMPGEHYGDYVIIDIDIDTGMITNWKKPTKKDIQDWIVADKDEED